MIAVLAIIMLVLITGLAVFHFTRPSVAFVTSDSFPSGYRLPSPHSFFKYRRTGNAENADLVIVAPDAAVPAGVEAYLFGRDAEEGESPAAVLAIDEARMWESAAADGSFAVIYEESSSRAAAIASHLALGFDFPEAIKRSKDYVTGAIENALELGKGCGPTNHFYRLWRNL